MLDSPIMSDPESQRVFCGYCGRPVVVFYTRSQESSVTAASVWTCPYTRCGWENVLSGVNVELVLVGHEWSRATKTPTEYAMVAMVYCPHCGRPVVVTYGTAGDELVECHCPHPGCLKVSQLRGIEQIRVLPAQKRWR